jgi:dipeptidase D
MYGAKNFDKTMLCGETLINLDGNKFGEFCIGSAGSVNLDATMPIEFVNDSSEIKFNLKISGLLSGHSGDEINKERANAIVLLGRVLLELRNNDIEIFLYDISGGLRSNLIPNNASMNFGVKLQDTDKLKNIISELKNIFHEEFADVESNIDLSLEKINLNNDKVFSKKTFDKLLARLLLIPNGVINMDVSIKDLVNTSNNLAILETCDDKIIFHLMLRSISPIRKKLFIDKINLLFNNNTKILSDNPTWNFNMSSEFINKISKIYAKKFHSTAKITAIHGGLECGYFSDRVKDMVCIGADIYDLHTVKERCEIKSVGYLWNFLREILKSK